MSHELEQARKAVHDTRLTLVALAVAIFGQSLQKAAYRRLIAFKD